MQQNIDFYQKTCVNSLQDNFIADKQKLSCIQHAL